MESTTNYHIGQAVVIDRVTWLIVHIVSERDTSEELELKDRGEAFNIYTLERPVTPMRIQRRLAYGYEIDRGTWGEFNGSTGTDHAAAN